VKRAAAMTLVQCFYLEYFCAFLTAVAFVVLFSQVFNSRLADARKAGGKLICRVPARFGRQVILPFLPLGFILLIDLPMVFSIGMHATFLCKITILFGIFILLFFWAITAFEIRQRGLVSLKRNKPSDIIFIPWHSITCGIWNESENVFALHSSNSRQTFPLRRNNIQPTLTTLGRFIEIRNEQGQIIHAGKPEPLSDEEAAALKKYQDRNPYQFSILSMLLLMIVVASASVWYSVAQQYNRLQQNALNSLSRFSPNYSDGPGGSVTSMDFSQKILLATPASPTPPKITDDEIAIIKPFHRLKSLNLSLSDITDAAIPDLIMLQSLKYLSIYKTKITPEGVERLRKEMPNTEIAY
jgi:hypothetical protein